MNPILRKFKTVDKILRASGPRGLLRHLAHKKYSRAQHRRYRRWLEIHALTDADRDTLRSAITALDHRPLISIILPVYNIDERWLRRCIDSVLAQLYTNWELCVADDASPEAHIRAVLDEYAATDGRVHVVYRPENGHISAASNSALELATGEFVVLLDHDDEISEDALYWVVKELNDFPDTAVIYSDEDLIDDRGRRFSPKFKPDFSRDLFYSLNLLTHLSAFRTDLVREAGAFRIGFEGSQDYDLGLRVLEKIDETQIRHIPRVLYHWRVIRGSVAFSMDEKPYAHERARAAIRDHFSRTRVSGEVFESFQSLHRVSYARASHPTIAAVVTTAGRGPREARLGLGENIEVIEAKTENAGRAAMLNQAASRSNADVLVFVDGNLQFTNADSVHELAGFAMQTDVGAVGAKILSSDLFVEEAGVVLGRDLMPASAHRGFPRETPGNMFRNWQIGNYSAISISCLVIRKALFERAGGFDAEHFPEDLFDIDLCLRLREMKKRIVILPHVELLGGGRTTDRDHSRDDLVKLRERWPRYAERDPFCSPHLKRDGSFEIDV